MTEKQQRPQLREKWLFVADVPLLFPTESVTKQMTIEIMFAQRDKPMVVRGVETAETVLHAMKEAGAQVLMTPEQVKHDREAVRGYLV